MTEAMLQYFHAWYNKELFNNELEPAMICVKNTGGELPEIQAEFIRVTEPFVIRFNIDVPEEEETEADTIYYLTVLLHEMVHQYCEENDIDDTLDGEHMEAFEEEAENRGLIQGGYRLSNEIKEKVIEQVECYKEWRKAVIDFSNHQGEN